MEKKKLNELSQLLKALGEYNRLSLVYELCGCEKPKGAMLTHRSIMANLAGAEGLLRDLSLGHEVFLSVIG